MGDDSLDRINWHLRLGEPGPVEQAAVAVAARELAETDVDLATWRRAADGARDDTHACERYIRRRVTKLRRELRAGSGPLLAADRQDQAWWTQKLARGAAAYRATPEGEQGYQATLSVAIRGLWTFSLLYFVAALLILLVGVWLGSA
ncbi:hypothetical protein [Rubrivirga sp. IMCC43871]|uniref:hypothetical protein n=1 Tax=Rubrivirga sp. IMCC43871 TaxID=3391575 RepID=UPI00398FE538